MYLTEPERRPDLFDEDRYKTSIRESLVGFIANEQ
jgi:hypothetical protein